MRYIYLTITAIFLSACSPKYEIKTLYTPPTDHTGRQCIQSCHTKQSNCQNSCNAKQSQCFVQKERQIKDSFPAMMNEYNNIMRQYEGEMIRFDTALSLWERKHTQLDQQFHTFDNVCRSRAQGESYECRRASEVDDELQHMSNAEPIPPQRPVKPLLSYEIKQAQKSCTNECDCQKVYDSCYISCGGTLKYEKFCVENCD